MSDFLYEVPLVVWLFAPIIGFFYSLIEVAWIPLLVLWFGLSLTMIIVTVGALGAVFASLVGGHGQGISAAIENVTGLLFVGGACWLYAGLAGISPSVADIFAGAVLMGLGTVPYLRRKKA